jgi:hypothetical protein
LILTDQPVKSSRNPVFEIRLEFKFSVGRDLI